MSSPQTRRSEPSSAAAEGLPRNGVNNGDHQKSDALISADHNSNTTQVSSKVSYDNPAFAGLSVNSLEQTPNYTPNGRLVTASHDISLSLGNSTDKLAVSAVTERREKDRTLSLSSIKSYKSIKNAIQSDRRMSRKMSIIRRNIDSSGSHLNIGDDNPLRRRMSFIKDTSGDEEPLKTATIQILIASLFAGFGNVGAGVVMEIFQEWRVFLDIRTMFILVPSLLGLKGNLEMTMASRLSTEANMGHMDRWPKTLRMIGGDMALVQCQATIISFLAAFVAIGIDCAQSQSFNINHCLVLTASSVLTANIACFLLGIIMAVVIVGSNKNNIDPDNIATPIAASLGDVSTAGFFALIGKWIYGDFIESDRHLPVLAISMIVLFVVLLPVFYTIARMNSFTKNLVHSGWVPIITAMIISSAAGFFLDSAVDRYDKLPPFQPVICGVGGNLVAVAASKISTRLHMKNILGVLPFCVNRITSPLGVFYNRRDSSSKLCLVLLLMAIPLHLLYSHIIWGIQYQKLTITVPLILLYLAFATLQVAILLFVGYNLIHLLWSYSINPDMSAIPILTSLGDLLGSAFLLIAFGILEGLKDPNAVLPLNLDPMSTPSVLNLTLFTNNTSI